MGVRAVGGMEPEGPESGAAAGGSVGSSLSRGRVRGGPGALARDVGGSVCVVRTPAHRGGGLFRCAAREWAESPCHGGRGRTPGLGSRGVRVRASVLTTSACALQGADACGGSDRACGQRIP